MAPVRYRFFNSLLEELCNYEIICERIATRPVTSRDRVCRLKPGGERATPYRQSQGYDDRTHRDNFGNWLALHPTLAGVTGLRDRGRDICRHRAR